MFSAEQIATVDRIFQLEYEVAAPKNGEQAILLASLTQQTLVRRAFYLANSEAFRRGYIADLQARLKTPPKDVLAVVMEHLARPVPDPEIDELTETLLHDVPRLQERYPLLFRSLPPAFAKDARPPVRSLETLLRVSMLCYSPATREALRQSFAALIEEGTSLAERMIEVFARLQGYSNADIAEQKRAEALMDAAYADEEEFLCGGEC